MTDRPAGRTQRLSPRRPHRGSPQSRRSQEPRRKEVPLNVCCRGRYTGRESIDLLPVHGTRTGVGEHGPRREAGTGVRDSVASALTSRRAGPDPIGLDALAGPDSLASGAPPPFPTGRPRPSFRRGTLPSWTWTWIWRSTRNSSETSRSWLTSTTARARSPISSCSNPARSPNASSGNSSSTTWTSNASEGSRSRPAPWPLTTSSTARLMS